jgi:hypothetical protein
MGEAGFKLTTGALKEWAATAEKGAACVYAIAEQLPQPLGAVARGLYEAGLVTLVRRRQRLTDPFEFLAIRTGRPISAPREQIKANRVMHARRQAIVDVELASAAVMGALVAAAQLGRRCPSNIELAEAARLPSPEHASKFVCGLRDEGRIDVELRPNFGRIVTIKASGLSTERPSR